MTRLPAAFVYQAAGDTPVSVPNFAAGGNAPGFVLAYAPTVGTNLTVINNTGNALIQGVFANLAQGQQVGLVYNGITYPFVANYYGGTGNDLVLQWATTRLLAWGSNSTGQLGTGASADSLVPVAVPNSGALAGKVVTAVQFGGFPMQSAGGHRLALCADGSVVAWGANLQA